MTKEKAYSAARKELVDFSLVVSQDNFPCSMFNQNPTCVYSALVYITGNFTSRSIIK